MTTNVVDSTGKIIALEILSSAIGCQKKDDGGVIMRVIVCVEVCCLIIADRAGTECFVSACCRWLMSVIAACI